MCGRFTRRRFIASAAALGTGALVLPRVSARTYRANQQVGIAVVGVSGRGSWFVGLLERDRAMRGFLANRFDILVATDIAARGIDVSGVSHVINYDVPSTPEAYTHRIGRTGRSEHEGVACTFVTGTDHVWLRATERMIGAPIQRRQIAGFEADVEVVASPSRRSGQRRRRGGQPGGQPGAGQQRQVPGGAALQGAGRQVPSGGQGRRRRRRRTG